MSKPIAAVGSNLVQIIGLVVLLFGVFNLPSAGAILATVLGGVLVAASTVRYMRYSRDD